MKGENANWTASLFMSLSVSAAAARVIAGEQGIVGPRPGPCGLYCSI